MPKKNLKSEKKYSFSSYFTTDEEIHLKSTGKSNAS